MYQINVTDLNDTSEIVVNSITATMKECQLQYNILKRGLTKAEEMLPVF